MKFWSCPHCKRMREFVHGRDKKVVLKVCYWCQIAMEVKDDHFKR